jgi:hypothetical protein
MFCTPPVNTKLAQTETRFAPTHGVLLGTPILCLDGYIPVEYLTEGDKIITRSGVCSLLNLDVTVIEQANVVRISDPKRRGDASGGDVVLCPEHPVYIRDWRAKVLTGKNTALVPALQLVDGIGLRAEMLQQARFFRLTFAQGVIFYAANHELGASSSTTAA